MAISDIEKKITEEAQSEAQEIKKQAKDQAASLLKEQKDKLKKEEELSSSAAEKEASSLRTKLISPVKIKARNTLLASKQEIIDSVYKDAMADLKKLGEKKYRTAIKMLLKSMPRGASGIIIPRAGREKVTRQAVGAYSKETKAKPNLSLKKGTKEISGGFIFKGEKINLDCSFDVIMRELKEQTLSQVSDILFSEKGKQR